jgi:hypothetical protein
MILPTRLGWKSTSLATVKAAKARIVVMKTFMFVQMPEKT